MYNEYFGLTRNPFELSPDPSFMCPSETSRRALVAISYAVAQRKGFVVMTGEVGTGKTLIVRSLFQSWKREGIAFANVVAPRLPANDLLSYAASDLGVNVKGLSKGDLLQSLYGFLVAQFEKGLTTVLVIDEAHQIPTDALEEIRMLTNIETNDQKLIQVILVGQPELDTKLDSFELRQLKQRVVVRCQLERLREEETRNYIQHRLDLAGESSKAESIFPLEAAKAVHDYSDGTPRLINTICHQALVTAFALQIPTVSVDVIDEVASYFHLQPLPHVGQRRERFKLANEALKSALNELWEVQPGVRDVESGDASSAVLSTNAPVGKHNPVDEHTSPGGSVRASPDALPATAGHIIPNRPDKGQETIDQVVGGRALSDGDLALLSDQAQGAYSPESLRADAEVISPTETPLVFPKTLIETAHTPETNVESQKPPTLFPILSAAKLPPNPAPVPPRPQDLTNGKSIFETERQGWSAASKRAALIGAGALVFVCLTASGLILRRQGQASALSKQGSAKFVDSSPANSPISLQSTLEPTPVKFGESSTKAVTHPLEQPIPESVSALPPSQRSNLVLGKLSRPVVRARTSSTLSEPPSILGVQDNRLPSISDGGLDHAMNVPATPAGGNAHEPRLLSAPPPVYPSLARAQRVQGVVVIDALIDTSGKLGDMRVVSGPNLLIPAAMEALRAWKYEPARLNGEPIAVRSNVRINFRLD